MKREHKTVECPVVDLMSKAPRYSEEEIARLMWCAAVSYLDDEEDVKAARSEDLRNTQPLAALET